MGKDGNWREENTPDLLNPGNSFALATSIQFPYVWKVMITISVNVKNMGLYVH